MRTILQMNTQIFTGCVPALMTPLKPDRTPDYGRLVETSLRLVDAGMEGVVYCGSMGDWPLLTDAQRMEGVAALCAAGIGVIVGTGAVNTKTAVAHAVHAADSGAAGLMVIPRVLSRGSSPAAQKAHFTAVLNAAPQLPAVIYNSPYYGFETRADLFFELRGAHRNLVGFKEFGGADSLSYAAEHITGAEPDLLLLVGVDTQVVHGYVNCGADGAITGIGNVLPTEVLHLVRLSKAAAAGDSQAHRFARELDDALSTLATFDEGPDLVLFYKRLMCLAGYEGYELQLNPSDALSASQEDFAAGQFDRFRSWWKSWDGARYGVD
jgi:dihydrodipicolinate synthase/N-acetylneuraminate lyase